MAEQQEGWYPDPSGDASRLRYWDGVQWTSDYTGTRAPVAPPSLQPPARVTVNVFAIVSLICALAGFFIPLAASIAAVIFGAIALKKPEQKGLAIAGLTLGILCLLLWLVATALVLDWIFETSIFY